MPRKTRRYLDLLEHWPEALACPRRSSSCSGQHLWRGRPLLLKILPAAIPGLLLGLTVLALRRRHQDAAVASWRRLSSCSALGSARISCGPSGATADQCRASGCCYDGNMLDGAARCFQAASSGGGSMETANAKVTTFAERKLIGLETFQSVPWSVPWTPVPVAKPHWKNPMCHFPDEEREDCGFEGVLEWQCLKAGCCFGEPNGPGLPFCYHGQDHSTTTTRSPTTTQFVLPTVPPYPFQTTNTATTTTTTTTARTNGSGLKGDGDELTILDALGLGGLGGWGIRVVPLVIGAVAACLMGAVITGFLVGCGRCRSYQADNGAYNTRVVNAPRGRNDSITGGSYQGLNPNSRYESLENSPDSAKGSWTSSQIRNPV
mmetsp:Transcript_62623/g.123776  ORF Transcript_62623/g.123776 Transcript_62623/m.123776 type:complete len:376 (-) Transcript_62623:77-1204(-)